MNRRLHNTYLALLASASTLALCLATGAARRRATAAPPDRRCTWARSTSPSRPADPAASHGDAGRRPSPAASSAAPTRSTAWPMPPP